MPAQFWWKFSLMAPPSTQRWVRDTKSVWWFMSDQFKIGITQLIFSGNWFQKIRSFTYVEMFEHPNKNILLSRFMAKHTWKDICAMLTRAPYPASVLEMSFYLYQSLYQNARLRFDVSEIQIQSLGFEPVSGFLLIQFAWDNSRN